MAGLVGPQYNVSVLCRLCIRPLWKMALRRDNIARPHFLQILTSPSYTLTGRLADVSGVAALFSVHLTWHEHRVLVRLESGSAAGERSQCPVTLPHCHLSHVVWLIWGNSLPLCPLAVYLNATRLAPAALVGVGSDGSLQVDTEQVMHRAACGAVRCQPLQALPDACKPLPCCSAATPLWRSCCPASSCAWCSPGMPQHSACTSGWTLLSSSMACRPCRSPACWGARLCCRSWTRGPSSHCNELGRQGGSLAGVFPVPGRRGGGATWREGCLARAPRRHLLFYAPMARGASLVAIAAACAVCAALAFALRWGGPCRGACDDAVVRPLIAWVREHGGSMSVSE